MASAKYVVTPPPYSEGSEPGVYFEKDKENNTQKPVDNSTSTVQQQPPVVHAAQDANFEEVQLSFSPKNGSGQVNAGHQDTRKKTFIPQIILACFVFWLFGLLFGLIAFILALLARRKQSSGATKTARDLGIASYVTSIVGIIVAVIILFALLLVFFLPTAVHDKIRDGDPSQQPAQCDGHFVNGSCYTQRSTDYTANDCTKLGGYYNLADKYCYYSGPHGPCANYVNQECYPLVDSSYTASTCRNIGGYFIAHSTQSQSSNSCYYKQFNCTGTYYSVDRQCYRFMTAVNNKTECDNYAGYYKHGICYYECPNTQFMVNGQCHDTRSAQYTQSDCEAVGGHYDDHNYCYLKGCNYTMINNKCYKSKSAEYSNGTCINIGGYYAAEAVRPYTSYCYYTSFKCSHHTVNGQCYSRASNHSQTVCKTIPQSYFDVSKNTCYYYCTEMPKLRQCLVADNPSFTPQTCRVIGGIYSSNTCYYIMLHCPMHNANNGQCYTNRSAVLTCDTCHNIGGHYEDGFCYYYQYNCSGYSVHGQCYSTRSSAYSDYSCSNMGRLYRNGFCYYEASKCRSALYKNCTCFQYRTTTKTAVTCAKTGGYYDLHIGQCFYNLSSCPYYNKNSQCYILRNTNFSRTTCSLISGYYTNERDAFGRYIYACYFDQVNCSNWANNQCYRSFSSSYNEGTCASIAGYYSHNNSGCYYNSFYCSYSRQGQCYDKYYTGWSKSQCDKANGYFYSYYGRCYISNYYCRRVLPSLRKCYSYTSRSYDCSSCRLLHGFLYSGTCYYKSKNCSEPLFLASNGQCYENQTKVTTAAACSSMSRETFYSEDDNLCHFSSVECSSEFYINCQCYRYRNTNFSRTTCSNIKGYYANESDESGRHRYVCYFNEFNCSNWANNQCYSWFSLSFNEGTCASVEGYYSQNKTGCYYNTFYCSYTMAGQCYDRYEYGWSKSQCDEANGYFYTYYGRCYISNYYCPSAVTSDKKCYFYASRSHDCSSCRLLDGFLYAGTCYYKSNCSEPLKLASNGQCYENQTTVGTAAACSNMSREAFYDEGDGLCYFSIECSSEFYVNCQCYKYRNTDFSTATCSLISGHYYNDSDELGRHRYACYFNEFNCSNWANNQCYSRFSSSYNDGTCASIGGYYSHNDSGCYYNSFSCSYSRQGQCYDTYYYGWSKKQCDEAKGYYYSWNEICYISNYYCPYVVASHNKCYFYTSQLYDCSSCRLVDGFLFAGTCYYKSNCSESLFLAGNGQCYENQTTIATAGDCSSLSEEGFYDEGHNLCYFSSGPCSSGHYVNCQCYIHRAEIYNDASCENFDGYYTNGRCYYNSSHCPDRYHSTNGQCYRQSSRYSASTCLNIGGYYDFPSTSGASGTCYYNHFNCSGFIVDGSHCYMNRSATYSRATCTNIGGIYGYYYSGRQYRSAGSYISPYRRYYCLYNTFNCAGYVLGNECHLYQSTTLSVDTCKNINGTYVAANGTCYYHEFSCPYYNVGGQCHHNVLCDAFSCDTCHLYGGYYEPTTRCCYYTSQDCKYFIDGECYENYTSLYNASTCDTVLDGYFLSGRCYYRVPQNCSAGHYLQQCTCYPHRSSTYTNSTCYNIGGLYADGNCYYMEFNCSGYAVNDQCYTRSSTELTQRTCDNIGGYFTSTVRTSNSSSAVDRCYYYTFDCPNNLTYRSSAAGQSQCFSDRSSTLSCPTCTNIGGAFAARYGCYFYSNNCTHLSAGGQCHTNRSLEYNASECQRVDGYTHSDGYCYFTPTNCSTYYVNCECYRNYSTSYTNATCINMGGVYFNGICYYNGGSTVRLAGSGLPYEGRLEVYYNGIWGTVCDDLFDDTDAMVACYSLGFGYVGRTLYNRYGRGTGPIWLDNLHCTGTEAYIGDCRHNGWGSHDCSNYEDVSIACNNG